MSDCNQLTPQSSRSLSSAIDPDIANDGADDILSSLYSSSSSPLSPTPFPHRGPTSTRGGQRIEDHLNGAQKKSVSFALNRPGPEPDLDTSYTYVASEEFDHDHDNLDHDDSAMARPPYHRPGEGRSQLPLLHDADDDPRPNYESSNRANRPRPLSRSSTFHERDPVAHAKAEAKKKYVYAAGFLVLSLISFTVQTETAVYIQHTLGWNKAYCMLWLTHGSWSLLWPTQLLILRYQKRKLSWKVFWRRHVYQLRTTAQMVEHQDLHPSGRHAQKSPVPYMLKMTALVTTALTIAGGSWYVAVDLTSPSDLTAIYNCSAFFAYVFSIPLLKEKIRLDKVGSVLVAVIGVLVVAYGDTAITKHGGQSGGAVGGEPEDNEAKNRALGNIVIGVGSVLYGLYEVLYKRFACPPEGTSPGRGMIFANTFGSLIGCFTFLVLWIPIPILHVTGVERFALPRGEAAWMLFISVLANATFSGSFLVLISLTSPVLSSVAALLTIFIVAVVDWLITGQPLSAAAIIGGILIIAAFLMLSWSTYRELDEERRKKEQDDIISSDSDE
ncbi:hypothetical protein L228DRAFT_270950 [Xylona heveae TC161]|uniref:EamA domain-containing protein n=1 Tax=Xylona heveae (strain CBS 132557 / TC161) TaxID=1328760 RepID=A0A164ZWK0_XYLHT|nr:hypothetical protein L228DRAFT_270950 [Xylona heveae TC161]KZF19623.1 hypothetical protein L228DRAFT_270950 [Xylona heveae TC161]